MNDISENLNPPTNNTSSTSTSSEKVILPLPTPDEQSLLYEYMNEYRLDISGIGELSTQLQDTLSRYERDQISELYENKHIERNTEINQLLDDLQDSIGEIQGWMTLHGDELNKMRTGIETIELKNLYVDLQHHNHTILHKCILDLLRSITLTQPTLFVCRQPDVINNHTAVVNAAKELYNVLNVQFTHQLDELQVVQQQSVANRGVKNEMMQRVVEQYKLVFQQNAENVSNDVIHTVAHKSMKKYRKLLKLIYQIDIDAYNSIRSAYLGAFTKSYHSTARTYFANIRHQLNQLMNVRDKKLFTTYESFEVSNGTEISLDSTVQSKLSKLFSESINNFKRAFESEQLFLASFFQPKIDSSNHSSGNAYTSGDEDVNRSPSPQPLRRSAVDDVKHMMNVLFAHVNVEIQDFAVASMQLDPYVILRYIGVTQKLLSRSQTPSQDDAEEDDADGTAQYDHIVGLLEMLQPFLQNEFEKFINTQCNFILHYSSSGKKAKHAGIYRPISATPLFINRTLTSSIGVDSKFYKSSFDRIFDSIIQMLSEIGKHDEKYADIMFVENLYDLLLCSQPHIGTSLECQESLKKVDAEYKLHTQRYIEWSMRYEMNTLITYWNRLDEQLQSTSADDIQFVTDFSRNDIRAILQKHCSPKPMQKYCSEMHARMMKHLPNNRSLAKLLWQNLRQTLVNRYAWFLHIIERSYKELQDEPKPTPNELSIILDTAEHLT